ncbi:hypothetical protein [Flavivirga jejuensis]|uniref:Uncharacterized protein n=1 Tax=Flavivirga jejuensis TaxID=870487 RepID=A0ABT8WI60_9FLAO|nr:hypothetical protein [Flavivirga jejuensis]MDO5972699.1 hypothetical protein [Flavivirga jejuensis]
MKNGRRRKKTEILQQRRLLFNKVCSELDLKDFLVSEIKKYGGEPESGNNITILARQHAYLIRREFKGKTIDERICNRRRALIYSKVELKRTIKDLVK